MSVKSYARVNALTKIVEKVEEGTVDYFSALPDFDLWIPIEDNVIAGIGYTYDTTLNKFYPQKPHNSWTLNKETCLWECPVDLPSDHRTVDYIWNDDTQTWDLNT